MAHSHPDGRTDPRCPGSMVLKNVVRETDEVGKGQIRMRTVFEQAIDQRSSTGARRNALSIWEPVCNEILIA